MELLVDLRTVIDEILEYHFGQMKNICTGTDSSATNKAEAAREIVGRLSTCLAEKEQEAMQEQLNRKYKAALDALFFYKRLWTNAEITKGE